MLVKMRACKAMPACRYCRAPSEVISMTACVQSLFLARARNVWRYPRPGIVILKRFGSDSLSILKRMVDAIAVRNPASSRIAFIISTVDDFPFVPVTPMTKSLLDGNPYHSAASHEKRKWYQFSDRAKREEGSANRSIFLMASRIVSGNVMRCGWLRGSALRGLRGLLEALAQHPELPGANTRGRPVLPPRRRLNRSYLLSLPRTPLSRAAPKRFFPLFSFRCRMLARAHPHRFELSRARVLPYQLRSAPLMPSGGRRRRR